MSKTMSEKILARASGQKEVEAGDIVIADIDVAMTHDLMKLGLKKYGIHLKLLYLLIIKFLQIQ